MKLLLFMNTANRCGFYAKKPNVKSALKPTIKIKNTYLSGICFFYFSVVTMTWRIWMILI